MHVLIQLQAGDVIGGTRQDSRLLQDHPELHGQDDPLLQRIRVRGGVRQRELPHDQDSSKVVKPCPPFA